MNDIPLTDSVTIPQIGFGTAAIGQWQQDDDYVKDIVLAAIQAGYRHIDTASLYGNERSVGRALEESGIARDKLLVVSKVCDTEQGYDRMKAALQRSLERLKLAYLDLHLIHWPFPAKTLETWRAMEKLHEAKLLRSLGLSNFRKSDIEQLLPIASISSCYNQLK